MWESMSHSQSGDFVSQRDILHNQQFYWILKYRENLKEWEYTWKTWNYHGILENLKKNHGKKIWNLEKLGRQQFLTFYFLPA